jgi:N-acetylmuramoyl-L-alanine amidase
MRARAPLLGMTLLVLLASSSPALGQKVFLNPSNQTGNDVAGGGTEADYALILANLTKELLTKAGFDVVVDQDFNNAPSNANSWGADIFVSMHTNAGGAHGTETLYVSDGGKVLATSVLAGLVGSVGYEDRGLVYRGDLHVLNASDMFACLEEAVFHDCTTTSGPKGHPPSESEFLRSAEGQQKIAAGVAAGVCAYFKKSCEATPEKGWLKGTVYEAPDLAKPLEGATVSLDGGQTAVTSSAGAFSFELAPGSYAITATKEGFAPATTTASVTAGKETWESLGLTRLQGDGGPVDAAPGDGVVTRRPGEGCSCRLGDGSPASRSGGWLLLGLGLLLRGLRSARAARRGRSGRRGR